jgi:pimeloyl-ACP methyl ester carboxylesterase
MKRIIIFLAILATYLSFSIGCMTMRTPDGESVKRLAEENVSLRFKTSKIEDKCIHYAITGSDTLPTLFFIHGSPGSWSAFKNYLKDKELLQRYRMISIDRPGFGYSNYGKGISISVQTELIGSLIKEVQNGKPFYIIGHSLGGPICVQLGAKYGNYINGIVLLAASVDPNEEAPEKWRPVFRTFFLKWLIPGAFRPSNDELWYFKKDVASMPADLNAITCPVVIIQGLKDPMVPPGNAYYAQKQLVHSKNVQLIPIEHANHFIPWTRFELIKNSLLSLYDAK